MDQYTPDAWHLLMEDLSFGDAKAATVAVCKRSPFCSPAEIRAEIRQIRAARLRDAGTAADQVDVANPDDVGEWQRALVRLRRAIADGQPPRAPGVPLPARPVGELLTQVGRAWSVPAATAEQQPRSA